MLVIVAPGQGSQAPGFLSPWLEHPSYAARLAEHSAHVGLDLAHLGTRATDEELLDTAVAQPLLVAAGLVAARLLLAGTDPDPRLVVAGHSVGELAAAALAGVLNHRQALDLAVARGGAMARAASEELSGMTAVLGGEGDQVRGHLARLGLTVANVNGAGHLVAAGSQHRLAALQHDPPPRSRLVPLPVAGAFHTDHMRPALEPVRRAADALVVSDPRARFVTNRDGSVLGSGARVLAAIVDQVVRPVRWDRCTDTVAVLGVSGVLELPPSGTLAGLARRALPGVETFELSGPDRLEAGRQFVTSHLAR